MTYEATADYLGKLMRMAKEHGGMIAKAKRTHVVNEAINYGKHQLTKWANEVGATERDIKVYRYIADNDGAWVVFDPNVERAWELAMKALYHAHDEWKRRKKGEEPIEYMY